MGLLIETAEQERRLLHELRIAIESVEAENKNYLPRFLTEVKEELLKVVYNKLDYNNVKMRYYKTRELLGKLGGNE